MPKSKIFARPLFIFLLTLLVALGGVAWYWYANKKKIIRNEIEKAIAQKSEGLYKIKYDSMELDEVNGNLSVSSFQLRHDSNMYHRLQRENKTPFLLFNISIPHIQISGVKTPRALLAKEITGRHLVLSSPVIEILYTNAGKDSTLNIPNKEIYKQILGGLEFIKLDSLVINNASIITKDMQTGKTLVQFVSANIAMYDLAIDSTGEADSTRLLYAKEINLDSKRFTWQSSDKRYDYQVDSIVFRSASSRVYIGDFSAQPRASETAFAKMHSFQTDRFDFDVHDIELRNTNFFLLADEIIQADSMIIGSASLKIYRDRTRPESKESKVGKYPHQLIQKIPVDFSIKKAIVKNSVVEYKEKSPLTGRTGKVLFAGLSATIDNITNRKEMIDQNNKMIMDTRSSFLNKASLYSKWTFYLGHPAGKFDITGEMGPADAKLFNSLAEPLGPASFTRGQVKKLQFDFTGNNDQISARVKLLYEDLRVALLEKNKDSPGFNKKTITSLFANIKIKNSNPDDDDEAPRIANVTMKRNPYRSIFNLTWQSLFDGVKEITGAK